MSDSPVASTPPATITAEPVQWSVNGLVLRGLAWGDPAGTPVLALHGWLDNAASFTFLAPHLSGAYVVAPDLTGHGHSDSRSADASYQIWDDLPELLGILDALDWQTFHLMGHSRGAIIATLLASALPERVDSLTLLDGVVPSPIEESEFPAQLRKALEDKKLLQNRASKTYASVAEALGARTRQGLSQGAARAIVERNLLESGGVYRWRTDPRLQGASAMKLTAAQSQAALRALTMPVLLLLASETAYRAAGLAELVRDNIGKVAVEEIPGHHHFHMEDGCEQVAQRIITFMADAKQGEQV